MLNTVPSAVVVPIIRAAAKLGHPIDEVWKEAAVSSSLRRFSDGSLTNIEIKDFSKIYGFCLNKVVHHLTRNDGRRPLSNEAFAFLCRSVIDCANLNEAVERATRFLTLLGEPEGDIDLRMAGHEAVFSLNVRYQEQHSSAVWANLACLSVYYSLFCWLIGERIPLRQVSLHCAAPMEPIEFFEDFQCPVVYGAASNRFSFPLRFAIQPLVRDRWELRDLTEFVPSSLTLPFGSVWLSSRVRTLIMREISEGNPPMDIGQLSRYSHMSEATFRRRLKDEGTSYVQIKDGCLKSLAIHYLRYSPRSLESIARRLCFSECDAFRRAFKVWTGVTPSQFRRETEPRSGS